MSGNATYEDNVRRALRGQQAPKERSVQALRKLFSYNLDTHWLPGLMYDFRRCFSHQCGRLCLPK